MKNVNTAKVFNYLGVYLDRVAALLGILISLLGMFFLTAFKSALKKIQKKDSQRLLKSLGPAFLYRPFHLFFFPKQEYEGVFLATVCGQNVARFCYAGFAVMFLMGSSFSHTAGNGLSVLGIIELFSMLLIFILVSFIFGDYLPRIFGTYSSEKAMRWCSPFSSPFLFLVFPVTFLFLKLSKILPHSFYLDYYQEPNAQAKQEIIDMIQDAQLNHTLETHDKKIIESVLRFRDRIAREVMVPRVDVFSLAADTSLIEAAKHLQKEGYSRTPVYRNTVDNIVGVLMYKDILKKYVESAETGNQSVLQAPIESIMKNILYTPETKKISSLLQEFRKKQVHVAIVVDEYGGTEGIVTIEDILEEIVGEISDEYDQEAELFKAQPDGSWIIDARMNILDIEEQLGIQIPEEGDYDTIGGYIFSCTGSIPSPGFVIHKENFEIEIISSNDRALEKVRIKPLENKINGDKANSDSN